MFQASVPAHSLRAPVLPSRAVRAAAAVRQRMRLGDDASDTQSYLDRFTSLWPQVRDQLDTMLSIPGWIQSARGEVTALREQAIAQGQADYAGEAEALFTELQTHESAAGDVASQIAQYRDTWQQIADTIGGMGETLAGWWGRAKRAVGLQALGLLPAIAVIALAVTALVAVVSALGIVAWWQTSSARLQAIRDGVLPASADAGMFDNLFTAAKNLPQAVLIGAAVLGGVMLLGRRR